MDLFSLILQKTEVAQTQCTILTIHVNTRDTNLPYAKKTLHDSRTSDWIVQSFGQLLNTVLKQDQKFTTDQRQSNNDLGFCGSFHFSKSEAHYKYNIKTSQQR